MDLGQLDTSAGAEEGAAMPVCHPVTNAEVQLADGTPVTITLAGVDSERYRQAERKALNRRYSVRGRRGTGMPTAEEIEADGMQTLVACTIAWQAVTLDGEMLPFSPENAKKLFTRLPWLREQAQQFMGDRANFLKG